MNPEQAPTKAPDDAALLPCPFCGGPVALEEAAQYDRRRWFGVVCRNTINLGGSCAMQQVPSASKKAAIARWNMRGGKAAGCNGGLAG